MFRSLDAHSCALTLVDSLCFQRVPSQFHDAVRPILTAAMLFLSTFVHGNAKNQAAVWRQRSMLESCLGDSVGAEFVLAEVSQAVPARHVVPCCNTVLYRSQPSAPSYVCIVCVTCFLGAVHS